jgi:outer membrane protein
VGLDPTAPLHVSIPRLPRIETNSRAALRAAEDLPAVVAADRAVEASKASVAAAQAQYLPTLSLQANGSYTVTRYDTTDSPYSTASASAGLVVSVPVFEAALAPGVAAARAGADNSQASADLARRNAREEAARAWAGADSLESMLEHARKAAEDAAGVLAIVQARYLQGLSSPLELIDAESSDSQARVAETQAELGSALAIVRLLVATGRKVEEAP